MAVIATDTFTGTNGTMPASWSILGGGGNSTATINNNRFRLTGNTQANFGYVQVIRSTPINNDDLDVVLTFETMTAATNSQYFYVDLHHNGSATAPTAYNFTTSIGNTDPDVSLRKAVNGSYTTLLSTPDGTVNFTGLVKARFQAFRSTGVVRYKVWPASSPEPSAWLASGIESSPLPAGKVVLTAFNGNNLVARPIEVDDLTIDDNSVSAPVDAPAPAAPRIAEKWNGTALVRQQSDRWNGTALVTRVIEPFLIWDPFNRTSLVSPGITATGQTWIASSGSTWGTDGDKLYNVGMVSGQYVSINTGSRLQDVTVTLSQGAMTSGAYPAIIVGHSDVNTPFGYWIESQPSGALRVVAPFSTPDTTVSGVFTSTAAHTIRVRLEPVTSPAPANRITVWVNGVQKHTVDDTKSNRATGTYFGIRHGQVGASTVQKWNNLSLRTT